MWLFKKKNRKPRIAYREQRNGVKYYYIECYGIFGYDWCWYQDSKETKSLKEAEKMLKEITDKEIVNWGIIKINL